VSGTGGIITLTNSIGGEKVKFLQVIAQ
jgi:hypothetical protein